MKSYVKPLILASEDLSEGVFAASGMIGGEEAGAENGAGSEESHVGGMGNETDNGTDTGADTNVDPGIADPGTDNGGDMGGDAGDMGGGDAGDMGGGDAGDMGGGDMGGGDMGGAQDANEPLDEAEGSYSFSVSGSWEGNINYDMYLTNNSDRATRSLVATIPCAGIVNSIEGNYTSATVNGDNTVTIHFNNYGNLITPHQTCGPIYTHITGTGDFGLQ